MKIKPKVKKYPNGGKSLKYAWNKEDNTKIQPLKVPDYEPYSENINLDAYLKATQLFGDGVSFINPFVGRLISAPGDINDIVKNPKDIKNYITPFIPTVSKVGLPLRQAAKIDRFNMVLTGATTLSDLPEETWQTPKKQNGGSINKYPNGGRPRFEWSKGIDNIQPITQTQNNSSITTGNKKLSTEELKKAAEYTKKYNQQHLEEEYNNRQNKLKQSINAQKQPLSSKNLQTQTQSTGDKLSLAMNSKYGNPKDYPTLSGYIQGLDYINPFKMIGDMASGLGSAPQDVNEGNYLKAGLSVGTPLFAGATAGIGTQGIKPFVNNLVNPLAGTKEIVNNLDNKYLPKFKSEINWSKWNKEIPENTQLMKEYNAIDYRKNPLSDKEKEMYQWFDEQMRFDKLPETTNKQSIEVLDNFKQRIKTPEGQKRLKELGITEEQLLQDLKIVEDPNTYGYYRGLNKNTIAINPNHPLPKKVVRHEIEHGVQNALRKSKINKAIDGTPAEKLKALEINTTEIDDILSELTLRREGTPNKVWNKINTNETVNINDYKSLINNKQNATDYFLTGSDGAEKSAFLGEVQQYMMDAGKIPKNSYVQITPEMVKETMVDAMFDEKTGGKYLRLFNIIKADPKNYEIISKGLNKMLSITPLIGAGAYMQNKEYKNGGAIGNNGMFDMTNPNIYKALVPGVIGLGAASQIDKKEFGGNITRESDKPIKYGYGGSVSYKDFKKKYKDL